jgi:hypothetical protein
VIKWWHVDVLAALEQRLVGLETIEVVGAQAGERAEPVVGEPFGQDLGEAAR